MPLRVCPPSEKERPKCPCPRQKPCWPSWSLWPAWPCPCCRAPARTLLSSTTLAAPSSQTTITVPLPPHRSPPSTTTSTQPGDVRQGPAKGAPRSAQLARSRSLRRGTTSHRPQLLSSRCHTAHGPTLARWARRAASQRLQVVPAPAEVDQWKRKRKRPRWASTAYRTQRRQVRGLAQRQGQAGRRPRGVASKSHPPCVGITQFNPGVDDKREHSTRSG